jgi:hypothetical protein
MLVSASINIYDSKEMERRIRERTRGKISGPVQVKEQSGALCDIFRRCVNDRGIPRFEVLESPYGPTIAPVRMKATTGGTLIRLKTIPTTSAMAKMSRMSVKNAKTTGTVS